MKPSENSEILLRQSIQLKKMASITSNGSNKSNDPSQEIADTFSKIHDTIDNLDSKVNLLLEKHEAEFLFAWRNHIKKIKKELYDIKERADEKEKHMNSNERVVALEKQMALFRDESLRLYEEVEERKSELEIFKRKVKEQESELEILREENKELIKSLKMTEAKHKIDQEKLADLEKNLEKFKETDNMEQSRLSPLNRISLYDNFSKQSFHRSQQRKTIGFEAVKEFKSVSKGSIIMERTRKTSTKEESLPKDTFHVPVIKVQNLNRLSVTTAKENEKTESSNNDNIRTNFNQVDANQSALTEKNGCMPSIIEQKTQYQASFIMIEPKVYDSDLKIWFLDCIKSIKKEISSRKIGFSSTSNDIMKVQSLEEFKTIDKLRLLEMFLENEKLLNHMYQKIFPDRMREIETYLNVNNHNNDIRNVKNASETKNKSTLSKMTNIVVDEHHLNRGEEMDEKIEEYLKNSMVKYEKQYENKNSKIRVKSMCKASKSQPIRNRVIMKDGKLGLMC